MHHTTGALTGQKGIRLSHAAWLPDDAPKAIAVVVHGYGVHALYHRGHGSSKGVRAHVEHFDYFVDDLHLLVEQARAAHPNLRTFMVAHSMGGLIGTRYALRHQQ